jgi:Mrp family chromosome partitioning ATPase
VHEALARLEGYERLTILPARSALEQSSELLSGQRTADVVTELRTRYVNRILIVDLSPALLADDALAFSRHMQAALLVVGEGRTRREDVTRTIELLHDIPIVGTVLNASRERATGYF